MEHRCGPRGQEFLCFILFIAKSPALRAEHGTWQVLRNHLLNKQATQTRTVECGRLCFLSMEQTTRTGLPGPGLLPQGPEVPGGLPTQERPERGGELGSSGLAAEGELPDQEAHGRSGWKEAGVGWGLHPEGPWRAGQGAGIGCCTQWAVGKDLSVVVMGAQPCSMGHPGRREAGLMCVLGNPSCLPHPASHARQALLPSPLFPCVCAPRRGRRGPSAPVSSTHQDALHLPAVCS